MTAKAVAREWELPLLKLDTSRQYNKYVGDRGRLSLVRRVEHDDAIAAAELDIELGGAIGGGRAQHGKDGPGRGEA